MVAEKVEIITKSFKDEPAAHWTCDRPEFTLEPADKTTRYWNHFAYCRRFTGVFRRFKIKGLLNKYNKFMPIPIKFGTKTEKNWTKGRRSCCWRCRKNVYRSKLITSSTTQIQLGPSNQQFNSEDYKTFYHELYPMQFEEPLFHIHLNVDYPFNLTGIFISSQIDLIYKFRKIKFSCTKTKCT
jgi:molecular chaperone HtpG